MATTSNNISFAGEVDVQIVELISHKKEKIDIKQLMLELSIYEDIFSNTVSGSILVTDGFDLIHNLPLIGEEIIHIRYVTPTMPESCVVDYYGYVYRVSDKIMTAERSQSYLIHFTSFENIIGVNKKVSKAFDARCDQIVSEVFSSTEFLSSEVKLEVEQCQNNIKFVSPMWNPMKTINWVSERAINKNGSPTYLFYETLDSKFHFKSLESLYTQIPKEGIKYRFDNYLRDTQTNGSVRNVGMEYSIIRDFHVEESFDYLKRIMSGVYASKLVSTNLISKTIKTTSMDYLQDFGNRKHLQNYPVTSDDLIRRRNASIEFVTNSEYAYDGQRDFRHDEWLNQRKALLGQANFTFKVDMTVSGRSDIHAGDVVEVELAQHAPINRGDSPDAMINNYFRGKFLIGAIHHKISERTHTMVMQCFTDSASKEIAK